jgi:arsenate reductase
VPYWPGHPISAHWGFEDPASCTGSDAEQRAMFQKIFRQILARVNLFASLPLHMLDKNATQAEVTAIGKTSV